MSFTIAGVGSRTTPLEMLEEVEMVGEWCRANKVTVRSGHAHGFDYTIEHGAQELCVAYLPWRYFNDDLISKATLVVPDFTSEAMTLAEHYHPAWNKLNSAVKQLIARDGFQVLGSDLKTPVNAVVCWTPGAKVVGGTGQALRIAKDYSIPILNMGSKEYDTADKVIHELEVMMTDM